MSEKRFSFNGIYFVDNETGQMSHNATEKTLNLLYDENEQLRKELEFYNKIINFFADNPMTKYSSRYELLEEMKLFEKMGLI